MKESESKQLNFFEKGTKAEEGKTEKERKKEKEVTAEHCEPVLELGEVEPTDEDELWRIQEALKKKAKEEGKEPDSKEMPIKILRSRKDEKERKKKSQREIDKFWKPELF